MAIMRSLLLLLCSVRFAAAQEGPGYTISTDRPSVGTGPDVVPAHYLVMENGVGWTLGGGDVVLDGPESFLRVGIGRGCELRAVVPDMSRSNSSGQVQRQDGDFSAKLRVPLFKSWPAAAVVGVSAPMGSADASSRAWDPVVLLSTTHAWQARFSTQGSGSMAWVTDGQNGRKRATQLAFDGIWSYSSALSSYLEWAPLLRQGVDATHTADVGVQWVLKRRIQLDAHVGTVVSSAGLSTVLGGGYSFSLHR